MTDSQRSLRRRAGFAWLAGALLTLPGCAVMALAQSSGDVADGLYNAPLTESAFVVFCLYAAVPHLVFLVAALALRRSGLAGTSRAATAGLGAVMAGTALLAVSELASIPLAGQPDDGTAAYVVNSSFGLATVLVTFGMLAVGVAVLRDAAWSSWRRYAPLACGSLSFVVIPVQFTGALWVGVAIFALGYAVLGLALATEPVARPAVQVA